MTGQVNLDVRDSLADFFAAMPLQVNASLLQR
jgi:hypothetical protein